MTENHDIDLWRNDAACRGLPTEWWYPDQGDNAHRAKAICAECPVTTQCGNYAEANEELYGIWGGGANRTRRHGRQIRAHLNNSDRALAVLKAENRWLNGATIEQQTNIAAVSIYNTLGRLRDRGLVEHDAERRLWRIKKGADNTRNTHRALEVMRAEGRWLTGATISELTGIPCDSTFITLGRLRDRGLVDHNPDQQTWRAKTEAEATA